MKIVILGCGYLGYHLYETLKQHADVQVWGFESFYSQFVDDFYVKDAFETNYTFDENTVIIDCMTLVSNMCNDESKLKMLQDKYDHLFKHLEKQSLSQYIFLSSGGTIYGDSDKPLNEQAPLKPRSIYAKSKVLIEEMLVASSLPYLIVRLTNPYGGFKEPGKTQGVIDVLMQCVSESKPFVRWGSLKSCRDYIYIDDFTQAILHLILNHIQYEIVNVSSGSKTSLNEVINTICQLGHTTIEIVDQTTDVPLIDCIVLSNDKLYDLVQFRPKVTIKEGIEKEMRKLK